MYTSEGYKSRQDFVESRSKADRRNKGSLSIRSLLIGGRRETIRRHEDQQRLLYVDQYSQSHFIAIVLILFLSVIDAILTIVLTNNGATEINPIMAYYLDVGPFTFLSVKYSLTSVGLFVLLIFRNIILKPTRIYAGYLFYYLLVIFIGVVSWQLFLTYRLIG
jgi:hypothetical protein